MNPQVASLDEHEAKEAEHGRRWESSSGPLWPRRIVGATGQRGPTEKIWYYDLSDIKVGKKTQLTTDRFDEFFRLIPTRGDSDRSWTATRAEIEARGYDLKAVNPRAKSDEDTRKTRGRRRSSTSSRRRGETSRKPSRSCARCSASVLQQKSCSSGFVRAGTSPAPTVSQV